MDTAPPDAPPANLTANITATSVVPVPASASATIPRPRSNQHLESHADSGHGPGGDYYKAPSDSKTIPQTRVSPGSRVACA